MIPKRLSCPFQSPEVPWWSFGRLWEEHQEQGQMEQAGKLPGLLGLKGRKRQLMAMVKMKSRLQGIEMKP